MALIKKTFLTRDAADAFIAGLEYVNDSAIQDIELIEVTHADFVVQFTDEDHDSLIDEEG